MSSYPIPRFLSLTVIILHIHFSRSADIAKPTEANGVILAAQQGDIQSFQFWVCLPFQAWRNNIHELYFQNHTKFKLVFAVHGEEFEGKLL